MEQKIKFSRSQKVYLPGEEKIATPNPEVYVYDTSGPFSDPSMSIDLKKGLPRLREEWIVGRGDVEQLPEITSEYGQMRRDDKSLDHLRFEKGRSHHSDSIRQTRNHHSGNGICGDPRKYEL